MDFNYSNFAGDLGSLPLADLYKKYHSKLPENFDIQTVLREVHAKNIELSLINRDWNPDDPALYGYFMIYDGSEYSAFLGERGGMQWLKKSVSYDEAAYYKIELIVNTLRP